MVTGTTNYLSLAVLFKTLWSTQTISEIKINALTLQLQILTDILLTYIYILRLLTESQTRVCSAAVVIAGISGNSMGNGIVAITGVSSHPVSVLDVADVSGHPVGIVAVAGVSGHPVGVLAVAVSVVTQWVS